METEADNLGLQHDEILWSEPLEDRIKSPGVADYLLEIAAGLQPGGGVFGRFHAWETEE